MLLWVYIQINEKITSLNASHVFCMLYVTSKHIFDTKVLTHEGDSLPRYPLSMEIIDPEADNIPCDTEDNQDGTYTIKFRPQISGAHLCKG